MTTQHACTALPGATTCPLCLVLDGCGAYYSEYTWPFLDAALRLETQCVCGALWGHALQHPHPCEATACPGFTLEGSPHGPAAHVL